MRMKLMRVIQAVILIFLKNEFLKDERRGHNTVSCAGSDP